jgi:hypothetical protein
MGCVASPSVASPPYGCRSPRFRSWAGDLTHGDMGLTAGCDRTPGARCCSGRMGDRVRGTARAMNRGPADGGVRGRTHGSPCSACSRCEERCQQKNYKSGAHHEGYAENTEHHQCKTLWDQFGVPQVVRICLISCRIEADATMRWGGCSAANET